MFVELPWLKAETDFFCPKIGFPVDFYLEILVGRGTIVSKLPNSIRTELRRGRGRRLCVIKSLLPIIDMTFLATIKA